MNQPSLRQYFTCHQIYALLSIELRLVNVDDIERSNEKDNNNEVDHNSTEDEFSNDTEEDNDNDKFEPDVDVNYAGVDIIVSFEPCNHLKYRDKNPNAFLEDYGDECKLVYAHAHFFGKVFL